MKRTMLIVIASIFLALGGVAFAANNHTITFQVVAFGVVNLNPGANVALVLDGTGVTAGSSTINVTHNTNWIQYTFVSTAANTGIISVALGAGAAIPAWLTLNVTAANPAAGGGGDKGVGGTVGLTPGMAASALLTSISGCYTGAVASTDGSQLTYALTIIPAQIALAAALPAQGPYTVTYTVTP